MTWRKRTVLKKHCPQRVEKAFSPPRGAGIHRRPSRFPCALRPEIGAFLETGSLSPPLAAHRPFPFLGFPAHTLPYRYGGFTTLSTVSGRKYTPSAQPVSVRFAPGNRGPSSKRARFLRRWRRIACFPFLGFPRTPFTRKGYAASVKRQSR